MGQAAYGTYRTQQRHGSASRNSGTRGNKKTLASVREAEMTELGPAAWVPAPRALPEGLGSRLRIRWASGCMGRHIYKGQGEERQGAGGGRRKKGSQGRGDPGTQPPSLTPRSWGVDSLSISGSRASWGPPAGMPHPSTLSCVAQASHRACLWRF